MYEFCSDSVNADRPRYYASHLIKEYPFLYFICPFWTYIPSIVWWRGCFQSVRLFIFPREMVHQHDKCLIILGRLWALEHHLQDPGAALVNSQLLGSKCIVVGHKRVRRKSHRDQFIGRNFVFFSCSQIRNRSLWVERSGSNWVICDPFFVAQIWKDLFVVENGVYQGWSRWVRPILEILKQTKPTARSREHYQTCQNSE